MQLQYLDWTRIIPVFITQSFLLVLLLFMSYKILKRNRSWLSVLLSTTYILTATAFIINLIYVPIRSNPTVYVLYFICIYIFFLGAIFLVIFNLNLLKMESKFALNQQIIIILIYAVLLFIIFLVPGGFTISDETSWRPKWSLYFFFVIIIIETSFIGIPLLILLRKINNKIQDETLKKRWKYYNIGVIGWLISYYCTFFYSTWDDFIIRAVLGLLTLISIPSSVLIYYATGREL